MRKQIESLFKVEPPFTKVKDGHGYIGVILRDKKTDTIQCHVCGKWFKSLGHHLRFHKTTAIKYKKKFGLPLNFALCGKDYSGVQRINAEKNNNWVKGKYKKGKKKEKETTNWKKNNKYSHTCEAYKNKFATCDKQIFDRFMVVSDIVEKDPSINDLKKYDSSLPTLIIDRWGSINNFRKKHKLSIIKETPQRWDRLSLIGVLRKYYQENGKPPACSYFNKKRKNMPQKHSFFRHFGSWNKALAEANLI